MPVKKPAPLVNIVVYSTVKMPYHSPALPSHRRRFHHSPSAIEIRITGTSTAAMRPRSAMFRARTSVALVGTVQPSALITKGESCGRIRVPSSIARSKERSWRIRAMP